MFPPGTSGGDADLIGLVSSFLGPPSDPGGGDGPEKRSASSAPPPRGALAPSTSGDAAIDAAEGGACCSEYGNSIPPARVVVFSKDRPWQLQQLLRSMKLRGRGLRRKRPRLDFNIYIILRASSPDFSRGYEKVPREHDGVHVLIEGDDDDADERSFSSLLEHALTDEIEGEDACENVRNGIVLFLTDDCLLLEPLEDVLACASGALRRGPVGASSSGGGERVYNFLSRLHPGISWCQTRGVASPPPRNEMKFHSLTGYLQKLHQGESNNRRCIHDGVYLYNRNLGSGEWAYQFDLSGGAYLHRDVMALLNCMNAEEKNHPNTLEMQANQLLNVADRATPIELLDASQKSLSAIPSRPLMLILAVNRVQDVCQAPLALPREGGPADDLAVDPGNPASLLTLLEEDCHLDVEKYKSTIYNSSHIGDLFMKRSNDTSHVENGNVTDADVSEPAGAVPNVSVLIPVHRGPPHAAKHSIISIMMQPIEEFDLLFKREGHSAGEGCHKKALLSPMQIVLVDDRCNDGSIDAIISSCNDLVKCHDNVTFQLQDHRSEELPPQQESMRENGSISISLDIVCSPRAGISGGLNYGLRYCRADLVARMDADDVATPHRLLSQIGFMRDHPSYAAVGTSTVLFSANATASGTGGGQDMNLTLPYDNLTQNYSELCYALRPSLSISDPGFMAWAMFFTCSISHPSVVFQKKTIQDLGGYDESISHCEDYDLWLRLLNRDSRSIVCLPILGLWHRKHSQSSSAVSSKIQREESDKASCRAMEQLFCSTNDDNGALSFRVVSTLRNPSSAQSSESLDHAAKLLQKLENCFLDKNCHDLSPQEFALVKLDCDARIGELAMNLITNFGGDDKTILDESFTWRLWCERCPEKQLERLSLLCHMNASKVMGMK